VKSIRSIPSSLRTVILLTLVALIPVGLLAASSIALDSHEVTTQVDKRVVGTAGVSAVVVSQQTTDLVALLHSYATRHSLLVGLTTAGPSGSTAVDLVLASLAKAVPGITASFVTDISGTSRYVYPAEPSVIGTNFAYREWYTGLLATGKPYVSSAIVTKEADHALAITVTDFILAADGTTRIGVIGINYSLLFVASYAADVGKAQGITLQVTDRNGTSLTAPGDPGLVSLASDPRFKAAHAGNSGLVDYAPTLPGGGRGPHQLSAYTPVAGTGWTIIASLPKRAAYAGAVQLRDTVLAIAAVLVIILLLGVWVIARSDRRRRSSELQAQSREREMARVLDSTDEAFVSMDSMGNISAWNAKAADLYGWPPEEVLGRSMLDVLVPDANRDAVRDDLEGWRAGMPSFIVGQRVEMAVMHRDGHQIAVEAGVWALDDGAGFSALVHDISDRVASRAELEEARDQAMQASRLKSEFLANMSHEIRTPMNGVIGMSGLLLKTNLSVVQRDYAETVCSSAEALLTVIDDILDFSKIEAGKLDVETVTFDLRSVVEESALLLAARAQQGDLELTCDVDPALPAALQGDPGRLRQVLLNLLGNAVKFTSYGEINVSARLVGDDATGTVDVEISVRDTGIGMTHETLEHLFDAFTQADTSTSRRYGGTGLGLAISRQLVELMGGTLDVTSAIGAGSTFTAVIPFAVAVAPPGAPEVANLVGVRMLIVDDNATNRRVLTEMVAAWGCLAVTASGAAEALLLLRDVPPEDGPFDVILLDLNMPDIDGYSLARSVRADPELAHVPMVMLTSSAQRGEAERTQQAGIVAYLTKPVRSAQLRSALNNALDPNVARPHPEPPGSPSLAKAPNSRGAKVDGVAATAHTGTVLVVEDNLVNQKVFTALLASIGYQADIAINGFDALEALDRTPYDAVFMDCQMPVMDGYQTTEKVRLREGDDRHTCIIAVTASAMAADRDRCLDAGMDDYMTKPIKAEDLDAKLTYWLRK
jgi:PAS domain S-box-containing protein